MIDVIKEAVKTLRSSGVKVQHCIINSSRESNHYDSYYHKYYSSYYYGNVRKQHESVKEKPKHKNGKFKNLFKKKKQDKNDKT